MLKSKRVNKIIFILVLIFSIIIPCNLAIAYTSMTLKTSYSNENGISVMHRGQSLNVEVYSSTVYSVPKMTATNTSTSKVYNASYQGVSMSGSVYIYKFIFYSSTLNAGSYTVTFVNGNLKASLKVIGNVDKAVNWTTAYIGRSNFIKPNGVSIPAKDNCACFVQSAYNSNWGDNAYNLWTTYGLFKHPGDWNAPRGSLVFFAKASANKNYGHVGLSLGNGNIIEAGYDKIKYSTITAENKVAAYLGWAWPSTKWPGW